MASTENSRRQFLRNASLASLGLGLAPALSKGFAAPVPEAGEACDKTTLDYFGEGPFYTANPPALTNGQLAGTSEPGTRIIVTGRVHTLDCTQVIPSTTIDVWHANDAGQYDNSGYNLRGVVQSNAQGFYLFETVKPGKYLNGSQYRPSHIHFKITPPGFPTLTTQLYFQGDSSIANDPAASITTGQYDASSRIIALTANANGTLEGTWDIAVDGNGSAMGINDLHIDKGMIYEVSPNPFTNEVEIRYGVFNPAQVSIMVFDLQGREVATLEERFLKPEKYTARWQPPAGLPSGHYFISLKVNDLQVHYQKIVRA